MTPLHVYLLIAGLISAFVLALNNNNQFSRFHRFSYREGKVEGLFSRHDYQPKMTWCEANCWGAESVGYGSFSQSFRKAVEGKTFARNPFDWRGADKVYSDPVSDGAVLECRSSAQGFSGNVDFVVTDPPYAGNVNYSELADFFYVWIRLSLQSQSCFAPELTPKVEEIVENPTRDKSAQEFEEGLCTVFRCCFEACSHGLLVFTFHHSEGTAWEALLRSVLNAGYEIDSVYPIQGEAENSLQLLDKQAISYDLIHVCKRRSAGTIREKRSWPGIKQEIRRRARVEVAAIEAGRYGNEPLSPNDTNIVLIGKCLELYSRHYGAVIDHEGKDVPLHEALKQIRDIADQMVEREHPLPSELDDIDPESRVYLRALCRVKEVKSDEVHKVTRGVLEPAELIEAGLITKMRLGRGRTYEVKQPGERLAGLQDKFRGITPGLQDNLFGDDLPGGAAGTLFVDRVHLLLGLAEVGENVLPWLDRFRAETPQIRAAMEYIEGQSRHLAAPCRKVLNLLEIGPLLKGAT